MRKIYTSIDIGTSFVKVLVSEINKDKLNVLSSSCVKSKGIKYGLIIDANEAVTSIKEAIAIDKKKKHSGKHTLARNNIRSAYGAGRCTGYLQCDCRWDEISSMARGECFYRCFLHHNY